MIRWVLTSFVLHMILIGVGWSWSARPLAWKHQPLIYQVELVRLPREKTKTGEETEVPLPAPIKEELVTPINPKINRKPPPLKAPQDIRAIASEDTLQHRPASAAQIRVDGQPFPDAYYLKLLQKRIEQNWRPPPDKTGALSRLSAVVRFRISRNGKIEAIVLEQKTGQFLYDQAAQRAIFNTGEMPPLPEEFKGDYLNLHIEFETLK